MVILDQFNLMAYFTRYNNDYFGGILPYPEFKFKKSYRTFGYFSCRYTPDYEMYDCLLEISDRYNYTEKQFRDIMVHEMIHYYLAHTKADLAIKHGKQFKNMANYLNSMFGLNITPYINDKEYIKKPSFSLGYLASFLL